MRRRFVLASLAALMLTGPFVAHGGPYNAEVRRGTAALIGFFQQQGGTTTIRPVALADGSAAFAFLFENEPSDVRGNFIFPAPDPKADITRAKEFVGCILIFKASNFDGGCEVLSPAYIETDPTFSDTSMVMTVQSFRPDGNRLSASLLLEGQGTAPQPVYNYSYVATPSPPARPTFAFAAGSAYMGRDAIVRGSIRSDLLGGGAIRSSTESNSSMMRGLFGFENLGQDGVLITPGVSASFVNDKILCLGNPPDVTCYPY